ncbi:hypothetical protein GGF46_001619 [Coemansia sp. RSA 552]|nr:hypothetical protein GGF46_001619 [Coemansia sp. RSA 552]
MSYLTAAPVGDGKTDEQRYEEFLKFMLNKDVIEQALEDPDFGGEYSGVVQEKIAADVSTLGFIFDTEDHQLAAARHRAMVIRRSIDKEIRTLCQELDGQIKYDLPEEDIKWLKEQEVPESEVDDEISVRPFCLYEVDIKHAYRKDLSDLPEVPEDFAKLALEHELDCDYENSDDDEDWEDSGDEDDEEEEEDEDEDKDEDEEMEDAAGDSSKGKGKGAEEDAEDDDDEEEEHVHGEGCCHAANGVDLDDDLPFDEEVTMGAADVGLAMLKDRQDEVVAQLEKVAGAKIDTFKTYHFPGRYYIVAWLKDFGIFGVRIAYPFLVDGSDDELDDSDDDDNEEGAASSSK